MPLPSLEGGIRSLASIVSRARIQLLLPRTVLISPLCATYRYGWARGQDGNVLVENRECTSANADLQAGSDRSGKEQAGLRRGQAAVPWLVAALTGHAFACPARRLKPT